MTQLFLPVEEPREKTPGWGGKRAHAGRPKSSRASVKHRTRPPHQARHPVHVTMRLRRGIPSLREYRLSRAVLQALDGAREAGRRVVQYSIQADHLHFVVEADSRRDLLTAVARGTCIRLARAINRALGRRGPVFADRYHARALTSPTTVRFGLVYVLQNWKKHVRISHGLDPLSSAPAFTGWSRPPLFGFHRTAARPVSPPRTWLASEGWLRAGGPLDPAERPGGAARFDGFD